MKLMALTATALCCVALALSSWVLLRGDNGMPERRELAFNKNHWASLIQKDGASRAHKELMNLVQGLTTPVQHGAAHAFGAALYELGGPKSIATCDALLSPGCLHEVVSLALVEKGPNSFQEINTLCVGNRAGSCLHSLGHGLVASIGYTNTDILKALSICKAADPALWPYSCGRGIFMEYNIRTVLSGTIDVRPVEDDAYAPCRELSGENRAACVYSLSQWWWYAILEHTDPIPAFDSAFADIGKRCASLPPSDSLLCFAGIGETIATDVRAPAKEKMLLCDASAQENSSARAACRTHLALIWHDLHSRVGSTSTIESACTPLSGAEKEVCLAAAQNGTGPSN